MENRVTMALDNATTTKALQLGSLLMGRTELGGVVDGARAHGYCHGVGLSQHGIQAVYVFPFGVHLGLVEDIRFAGGDAIAGEDFGYLGSSHVPCGLVGDDDGLAAGKLLGEDFTHGAYHATSQLRWTDMWRRAHR